MAEEQKRPVHEIKLTDDTHITIEDNNGRLTGGTLKAARERAFPWLEAQAKAWVKAVALYAPENVKKFIEEKESSKTPYREILKTIPDAVYKPIKGLTEIDIKGKGTVTYMDNSGTPQTCSWKKYLTEIGPKLEEEAIDLCCQPNPYLARKKQTPESLAKKRERMEARRAQGYFLREEWLVRKSLTEQLEKLTPEELEEREVALKTKGRWAAPTDLADRK